MMALRGKLGKFKFYTLPKSLQNIIKRVAYGYSNQKMKDASFIFEKELNSYSLIINLTTFSQSNF